MHYEYKLIPVNQATGKRAHSGGIKPQFTVNIDELHRAMKAVNPYPWLDATTDKRILAEKTLPRIFSEMFGAEVYFRERGTTAFQI